MRQFAAIVISGLLATTICEGRPADLALAGPTDLSSVSGGACQVCADDDSVTCTGTTCTKITSGTNKGMYTQKVGQKITPQKCAAAPVGTKNGFTKCKTSTDMPCFKYSLCTGIDDQNKCTGCSPTTAPAGNDKPTKCSTSGGYRCDGTGT